MFSLKKHFIMYVLNNKNYLCKKIIRRKTQVAKHEFNSFKCIFLKSEDIVSSTGWAKKTSLKFVRV